MKKGKIVLIILAVIIVAAGIAAAVILNSTTFKYSRQMKLADKYVTEKEFDDAVIAYKRAIEIDPYNAEAYICLAEIYAEMGEFDKALRIAEKGYKKTDDRDLKKLVQKYEEKAEDEEQETDKTLFENIFAAIEDEEPDNTEILETEPVEEETSEEIGAGYTQLVEDYIAYYNGTKAYDQTIASTMLTGFDSVMTYGSYDHSWLGDQGYFTSADADGSGVQLEAAFYDVNNDGTDELFIVERYGEWVMIHDVWTIINGNLKNVGYWDARYDLILDDDCKMYEISSGGWNSSTLCEMELGSDGKMKIIDEVDMLPGNGDDIVYQHNGQNISEAEFNAIADKYYSITKNSMNNMKNIVIRSW